VLDLEVGEYPGVKRAFVPMGCMHCEDPPCMHVCPSTATRKRADGIVTIDPDLCIGCAYCAVACPYDARFKVDGIATKCTFCVERIDHGLAHGLVPGIDPDATPARQGHALRRRRRPGQQHLAPARREPALPHARGARHGAGHLLPVGQGKMNFLK
jgi:Fe-S-cluster-containing dehydrogenase component